MRNNSRVNNRFGMNEYSSGRNSHGNEGKRKNERKGGNSDTNPSHDYPNSSPGFSDSKRIGKKPKLDDDSDQAGVKNQQKSSENKDSEHENFELNQKSSQKNKKKGKRKGEIGLQNRMKKKIKMTLVIETMIILIILILGGEK